MRALRVGWAAAFVVCWSSGFVGAQLAAESGSVTALLAWRYLITAVVLGCAVALARWRRPTPAAAHRDGGFGSAAGSMPHRRELLQQTGMGLLAHVVFLGGVFGAAAVGAGGSTVSLVCALQPMLVAVVGMVCWRDRVTGRVVAGVGVGLAAVAVSVGGGAVTAGLGVLLAVASLLGLSGAALLDRRWQPCTDLLTSLWIQVSVAAVVFWLAAAVSGQVAIALSGRTAGALVWLVLLSGIGGYLAFTACLRTLGSTTTSVLLYLTPPVTTVWVWVMFGDQPALAQWLGLALGAVAVALAWPRNPAQAV